MITVNEHSITIEATSLDDFSTDRLDVRDMQRKLEVVSSEIKTLAMYCEHKANAMDCRLDGDIAWAKKHDKICDRLYADRIPEWAKW